MKTQVVFLFLFFLQTAHAQYEAQLKSITQELSKKIGETGKKRIAVADFSDADGSITKLGQFISEEFNSYLPEAGQGFEVIERNRINVLLQENKDPKLGKLTGIEALIYGTITPFEESVRVNIKILDLQQGVTLGSVVGNIPRTFEINKLLSEVSESTNYDVTGSSEPDPKPTQSKDKNCAKNHKGDILFINKAQKDVLLEWRDPVVGELSIVVRAGNQHLAKGLYTRDGSFSYRANLYRNIAKKENPESYSIFVEECRTNPLTIK